MGATKPYRDGFNVVDNSSKNKMAKRTSIAFYQNKINTLQKNLLSPKLLLLTTRDVPFQPGELTC